MNNLTRFLEQQPAEIVWGVGEEVSLEQYIGTLDILEERYLRVVESLEQYDFVVDVARTHPDSPAFEGLGIEARTILSVSTESAGETLKKMWEKLKTTILAIIEKVRDFFGQLFNGYKKIVEKLKALEKSIESKTFDKNVEIEISNTAPLIFDKNFSVNGMEVGLGNNVSLGKFMAEEYISLSKTYYEGFIANNSKLSKLSDQAQQQINKIITDFNEGIQKTKTIPFKQIDQTTMLGNQKLSLIKDDLWGVESVILLHFKDTEKSSSKSLSLKLGDKSDLIETIKMAIQACETGIASEKKAKELTKTRKEVIDAHNKQIQKGTFLQKVKDQMIVKHYLKAGNRDLIRVLQQFHRHNYQSCRAVVTVASKFEQQGKST